MNRIHLPSLLTAAVALGAGVVTITMGAAPAHAEGLMPDSDRTAGSAESPWAGRQTFAARGDNGQSVGRRRIGSGFSRSSACQEAPGTEVSCVPR